MTMAGQYGYYITNAYPWVLASRERRIHHLIQHHPGDLDLLVSDVHLNTRLRTCANALQPTGNAGAPDRLGLFLGIGPPDLADLAKLRIFHRIVSREAHEVNPLSAENRTRAVLDGGWGVCI